MDYCTSVVASHLDLLGTLIILIPELMIKVLFDLHVNSYIISSPQADYILKTSQVYNVSYYIEYS